MITSSLTNKALIQTYQPILAQFLYGLLAIIVSPSAIPKFVLVILLLIFTALRIAFMDEDKRYVNHITVNDDTLTISYQQPTIRHLLLLYQESHSVSIPLQEIEHIEITKRNWLLGYPAGLNIKQGQEWTTYLILEKKLFYHIEHQLVSIKLLK